MLMVPSIYLAGFDFMKHSEKLEAFLVVPPNRAEPGTARNASGFHYGVDEMHTFDEDDLLPLNGSVAGHRLLICKPHAPQLRFEGF